MGDLLRTFIFVAMDAQLLLFCLLSALSEPASLSVTVQLPARRSFLCVRVCLFALVRQTAIRKKWLVVIKVLH